MTWNDAWFAADNPRLQALSRPRKYGVPMIARGKKNWKKLGGHEGTLVLAVLISHGNHEIALMVLTVRTHSSAL